MAENVRLRAMRTFYTTREGLVTLDDDVLSIVAQVKELYNDAVTIELDPETGEYLFIEHGRDGTDRLIFATSELDPRALERLRRADSQARGYEDPYAAAEREQDALQRADEAYFRERIRDTGERLAHVLKRGGIDDRLPLSVPVSYGKGPKGA